MGFADVNLKERGPRKVRKLQLVCEPELADWVIAEAARRGVSHAHVIRDCIRAVRAASLRRSPPARPS